MTESQTKPRGKNYAYNGHGQRSGLMVSKFDPPPPPRVCGWEPITALDQRMAQKADQ